jgi:DNA replication protein DnaC
MAPLKDSERRDLLEICDDRYQRRSIILTSQMPIAHWHEQIGDPTIADSILDRLVARRSEFVSMEGFSCGRRSISI